MNSTSRGRFRSRIIVLAVIIIGLVGLGGTLGRRYLSARRLPALPNLAAQPTAVRTHLTGRYEAARADPRSAEAVGALCLAYHADLYDEQADRCYALVADLERHWRWTYYRALLQSERGGGDLLISRLNEVLAQAPDFGPAWLRLGDAEFKEARYDRAEQAWIRATSAAEPSRPPSEAPEHVADAPVAVYASLGLARVALQRDNTDGARQTLERTATAAPAFGPAWRLLAETYSRIGRTQDAKRAITRANHLQPYAPYADPMVDALARDTRNSTFLLRQASEAGLGANAAWSEYLTRRAIEFDPDNPDAVSKLARMLRTLGRSDEALPYFVEYSRMVPEDLQGVGAIGSCLSDLGRFEEAQPFLRRAAEGLDDALTHYNLGALLSATGRFDEAIVEYERAVGRDPSDPDARSNLGAVLIRTGKLARAQQELSRALALDPENASAHTNLGLLLAQQGQIARAVAEFQAALRINPRQPQARKALRTLGK